MADSAIMVDSPIRRVPFDIRGLSVPFPIRTSPFYYQAKRATEEWIIAYDFIPNRKKRDVFFASEFSWFVCMVYPDTKDFRVIKAICDFMSFFFIFDDPCEKFKGRTADLQEFIAPLLAAIDGAHPADKFSIAFTDFLTRLDLPAVLARRFLDVYRSYIQGIVESSELQFGAPIDSMAQDDYVRVRRDSIGARPCFVLLERSLDIVLPGAVLDSDAVRACVNAAIDHIWISNDIVSFNKEIANNEHRGLIEYLRRKHGLSYQDAVDRAVSLANTKLQDFCELANMLRHKTARGAHDLSTFIGGLEYWLSGNLLWERLSYRYMRYNVGDA
jgi:Terpene synthase family 2, C-terminal metal binding